MRGQGRGIDPRPADDDHAQLGHAPARRREARDHPLQQPAADARAADGDEAHALARRVAELGAQRGEVRGRARLRAERVAREVEVLLDPGPDRWQPLAEVVGDDVGRTADEERAVAHAREAVDVLDHLRVVVGGQAGLVGAALGHRQPADEVGEEAVGRGLELRVLMQVVVELPRLVADPEVVGLLGRERPSSPTTSGSATSMRELDCTMRTGAQDRGLLLPHRFRRLAADARGRRRRGPPDHRLRRRDARAHPLPARARSRAVRRRSGRRGPPRLRQGAATIRPWVEQHLQLQPRSRRRARPRTPPRCAPGERVCVVTVGVGGGLLERVIASFPAARRRVPELRMIVVCGPRIDPASLPTHDGLEVREYVHGLSRHLAACDVAVVQGGLATCMDRAARPLYYSRCSAASSRTCTSATGPSATAPGRRWTTRRRLPRQSPRRSRHSERAEPAPVERDGAARAAKLIAELL